ncbi:MAG: hypothetical protein V1918_03495 [Planctomycetota bacterium]
MPWSSFQSVTLYDYLRILFQRLWILAVCLTVALAVSSYFACFKLYKRFLSSMEIMVVQTNRKNPYLRQMLPQESLRLVITDLRDRLQGHKRLRLLAQNLRLTLKNEYVQDDFGREMQGGQAEAVGQFLAGLGSGERRAFLARLELVTLAKLLGVVPISHPYAMNVGEQGGMCEYLLDGENEPFLLRLREIPLLEASEKASLERLHERAVGQVEKILEEKKLAAFSNDQVREIRKEILSRGRLEETGLYEVSNLSDPRTAALLDAWADRLKSGLDVHMLQSQLLALSCDMAAPTLEQAVPHLVVQVAYRMIQAEYYATEVGNRENAKREIRRQIDRLENELLVVNQELANHAKLQEIMLAYDTAPTEAIRLSGGLQQEDFYLPRVTIHIQRLNRLLEDKRKAERETAEKQAQLAELEKTLSDPEKMEIARTRVTTTDAPLLLKLRQEKAVAEEELLRARRTMTELHPRVKELRARIAQIRDSLAAAEIRESVVEVGENPLKSQWEAEKEAIERDLAALRERIESIARTMREETGKAVEAPQNLQEYEDRQRRRNTLRQQLDEKLTALAGIEEDESLGEGIRQTLFEVHRPAVAPVSHYAPNRLVIILIGALIGFFTAAGAVFFVEYADHSIKGAEDIRRHFEIPVLGMIPEFTFEELEKATIRHRMRWRRLRKLLGLVPPSTSPRQRIVARKRSLWRSLFRFLLIPALLAGAFFLYANRPTVLEYYEKARTLAIRLYARGTGQEPRVPTGSTPPARPGT